MNEIQTIQNKIYEIRGQRVMLDFATSNNPGSQDVTNWKSQIATSNFNLMLSLMSIPLMQV